MAAKLMSAACRAAAHAHCSSRGALSRGPCAATCIRSARTSVWAANPQLQRRSRRQQTRLGRPAAAAPELPDLDALLGDLDMPEIDADLASLQTEQGAVFDDAGVVVHFKNDARALYALEHTAALFDRSHWGRLRLAGPDRLPFLHGQSTADVLALQPGSGCDTVFTTAQARTLDLATVYAQGSGCLVVVSPGVRGELAARLQKHIVMDQVEVQDVSGQTCMFSLCGPQADAAMRALGAGDVCGAPYAAHTLLSFQGKPVIVAVGGGLPGPGYTLIADESVAAEVWRSLAAQEGVEPAGADVWQMGRVLAGRPAVGAELTEEFNPLEAGLYHAVSLAKGCYVGQETLAKVDNLGAVKRQLWLLEMDAPCAVGDAVAAAGGGEGPLGRVTSYVDTPDGRHRALAYLRCKSKGAQVELGGLAVEVAGVQGRAVPAPFLSRAFPEAAVASGAEGSPEELTARKAEAEAAKEAEEAARAEKLRAMQQRLAAWQAQQQQQ